MKQILKILLTIVVSLVIGCLIGYTYAYHRASSNEVKIVSDTVVVYRSKTVSAKDLLTIENPVPAVSNYILLPYKDEDKTSETDSTISLPIKQYITRNDSVSIWHSGVYSVIDSVKYNYPFRTITTKETIYLKPPDWSLGLYAGVSIGQRQHPYINPSIGVLFNYKRWDVFAEAGYSQPFICQKGFWYWQVGGRYNIPLLGNRRK